MRGLRSVSRGNLRSSHADGSAAAPGILGELARRIETRACTAGVVGLGYVGLPLAVELVRSGYRTVGFDLSERVVAGLNRGASHVDDVPDEAVAAMVDQGRFVATTELARLAECDVIAICVPTPLSKLKDPDLSYVVHAAQSVRAALRPGQLVILESTSYPGTTREVVLPILAESGLTVGEAFFLCYSPERVDPGNPVWTTRNTPKLLGGVTDACAEVGIAFYRTVVETVVPVSSAEVAELAKVYENTFRMVNIALANELAQVCARLGLDVWEVIEAAATKPFGFMRFTPGPGLGGHCIPLDPHYLSWRMEALDYKTRLIELASEINAQMPAFVVQLVTDALNDECRAVRGSRILVLGVAYKRDVSDYRESPALDIIERLQQQGAEVCYHDPHCPVIKHVGRVSIAGLPLASVPLTDDLLATVDAVVIATDHTTIDYQRVADLASLVVDARGVMRRLTGRARVIGLSGPIERLTPAAAGAAV